MVTDPRWQMAQQMYAAQQVAPGVSVYNPRMSPPAASSAVTGDPVAGLRAVVAQTLGGPQQSGPSGGGGSGVLGVFGNVLKPLSILGKPLSAVVSGLKEGTDLVRNTVGADNPIGMALTRSPLLAVMAGATAAARGDNPIEAFARPTSGDSASFADFRRQVAGNYGFGDYLRETGQSTGSGVGDRFAGFVGDVALDPLTYVTLGSGKVATEFAGRVGREALALKAVEAGRAAGLADNVVEELAQKAGRYGLGALNDAERALMGIERSGVRFMGQRIAGTSRLAESVGGKLAATRAGIRGAVPMMQSDRLLTKGLQPFQRKLLSGEGAVSATQSAATIAATRRASSLGGKLASELGPDATEVIKLLGGRRGDWAAIRTLVEQGSTDPRAVAFRGFADRMYARVNDELVRLGEEPVKYLDGWAPRVWTPEGRAWISGDSPLAQALRRGAGVSGRNADIEFERVLRAGTTIEVGGRQVVLDGTTKQLNELARIEGVKQAISDDLVESMSYAIRQAAKAVESGKFRSQLREWGIAAPKFADELNPAVPGAVIDPVTGRVLNPELLVDQVDRKATAAAKKAAVANRKAELADVAQLGRDARTEGRVMMRSVVQDVKDVKRQVSQRLTDRLNNARLARTAAGRKVTAAVKAWERSDAEYERLIVALDQQIAAVQKAAAGGSKGVVEKARVAEKVLVDTRDDVERALDDIARMSTSASVDPVAAGVDAVPPSAAVDAPLTAAADVVDPVVAETVRAAEARVAQAEADVGRLEAERAAVQAELEDAARVNRDAAALPQGAADARSTVESAESGVPFSATLFRGEGGRNMQGVGDEALLGPGIYATPDRSYAEDFARDMSDEANGFPIVGSVREQVIQLRNPLVIESDDQWRTWTSAAGWRFPKLSRNDMAAAKASIADLRKLIEDAGYDGVVVRLPRYQGRIADSALYDMFGGDQVVAFARSATDQRTAGVRSVAERLGPPAEGLPAGGAVAQYSFDAKESLTLAKRALKNDEARPSLGSRLPKKGDKASWWTNSYVLVRDGAQPKGAKIPWVELPEGVTAPNIEPLFKVPDDAVEATPVLRLLNGEDGLVVLRAADGRNVAVNEKYFALFEHGGYTIKVSEPTKPVYFFEGKTLVGVAMPVRTPTSLDLAVDPAALAGRVFSRTPVAPSDNPLASALAERGAYLVKSDQYNVTFHMDGAVEPTTMRWDEANEAFGVELPRLSTDRDYFPPQELLKEWRAKALARSIEDSKKPLKLSEKAFAEIDSINTTGKMVNGNIPPSVMEAQAKAYKQAVDEGVPVYVNVKKSKGVETGVASTTPTNGSQFMVEPDGTFYSINPWVQGGSDAIARDRLAALRGAVPETPTAAGPKVDVAPIQARLSEIDAQVAAKRDELRQAIVARDIASIQTTPAPTPPPVAAAPTSPVEAAVRPSAGLSAPSATPVADGVDSGIPAASGAAVPLTARQRRATEMVGDLTSDRADVNVAWDVQSAKDRATVEALRVRKADADMRVERAAETVGVGKEEAARLARTQDLSVEQIVNNVDQMVGLLDDAEIGRSIRALTADLFDKAAKVQKLDRDTKFYNDLYKAIRESDLVYPTIMRKVWKDGWEELGKTGLMLPKEVADAMRYVDELAKPQVANMFMRAIDAYTTFFKSWALATPGFHLRNAMSATAMNFVAGVEFDAMAKGIRYWRWYMRDHQNWWRKIVDPEEQRAARIALDAVFGSGAGQYDELSYVWTSRLGPPWGRMSQKAGREIEGAVRMGMALDTMRSAGGTLDSAIARINRYHFNYGEVSQFDETMKRIVPFWTFTSRNLPLQVQEMWMRPRVYLTYDKMVKNMRQEQNGDVVPLSIRDMGGFMAQRGDGPQGQGSWFVAPDLPWSRLEQEIGKFTDPQRFLSNATPLLRIPLETMVADKRFYNDVPFKQNGLVSGSWTQKVFGPVLDALGLQDTAADGSRVVDEKIPYALESLWPLLGQGERLVPTQDYFAQRRLQSYLNWLGIPAKQLTQGAIDAELRRREYGQNAADARLRALATYGQG